MKIKTRDITKFCIHNADDTITTCDNHYQVVENCRNSTKQDRCTTDYFCDVDYGDFALCAENSELSER